MISSLYFVAGLLKFQLCLSFSPESVVVSKRPTRQFPKLISADADLFFQNVVHMPAYLTVED